MLAFILTIAIVFCVVQLSLLVRKINKIGKNYMVRNRDQMIKKQ